MPVDHRHDVGVVHPDIHAVDDDVRIGGADIAAFEGDAPLAVDVVAHAEDAFVGEYRVLQEGISVDERDARAGADIGRDGRRWNEVVEHLAHDVQLMGLAAEIGSGGSAGKVGV